MKFGNRMGVVAALVVTLGIAGCGADAEQGQQPGQTASPSAKAAGSSSPVRLTTASFLPATKKAIAGKDTVRVTMRMIAAGQIITTTGVARFDEHDPAMSMTMNGPMFGGKARVILVNNVFYVSIPGQVPAGKYLKLDAGGTSPTAKSLQQSLDGLDPRKTFDAFDAGLRKVTYVGSETVDGLKLQHYKVSVDTKAAMAAQGQPMPRGLPKTITYDIWLDDARLMRKVTFKMAGVSTVMTANDYGKPVTIKAPPADDIMTR
jgi:LppX_LprAFG lipoprotein